MVNNVKRLNNHFLFRRMKLDHCLYSGFVPLMLVVKIQMVVTLKRALLGNHRICFPADSCCCVDFEFCSVFSFVNLN